MDISSRRKLGVEEEFQLIDLATRRLTPRAPELLACLPDDGYVAEMQRCVVEVNSAVVSDLVALRADLARRRAVLVQTSASMGMAIVAAGAVPLSAPRDLRLTETPRYRRMLADYQLLAREQLICGSQVHIDIRDRDEAVQLANRIAPYLPLFLALSASSPFWADGSDTGYASARSLVWNRWPSTGPTAPVESAAEYDALVRDLIASGVITDPGMVYFDLRVSERVPTLELRVCDSCPSLDTVILIAGLYRALVERESRRMRDGAPALVISPTLARAAQWRAARSGLEGELVDVSVPSPRPARVLIRQFLDLLKPELRELGDWELVAELTEKALHAGSSASRQRRVMRRRGRLTDVVDTLIAETAGVLPPPPPRGKGLLLGYDPAQQGPGDPYDEAIGPDGRPRLAYLPLFKAISALGPATLRERQFAVEREAGIDGLTFLASDADRPVVFQTDLVPRIISAPDWAALVPGLEQRALALNAFIDDVYGERRILRDGVVPPQVLDRVPGFRHSGIAQAPGAVRTHMVGLDLVCTGPGEWLVIEDNLRVPSGIGYALASREMLRANFPELPMPPGVLPFDAVPAMIRDTLLAAAPEGAGSEVAVALVTTGSTDPAWFEHRFIAASAGLALVRTGDLLVDDAVLYRCEDGERRRVDVLYVRMDEDMLLSSTGADGSVLRAGLLGAVHAGNLAIANALGNGVGDDKAVYAYVPAMIDYYFGVEPLLAQVPTLLCAERAQREQVLDRLGSLVVKPTDGFGGTAITIGTESSEEDLRERRRELLVQPERFIAQEIIPLSTHPTFDGTSFYPHHVDLRVFVHLRRVGADLTAHVLPAALSRVAARGSLVVNSSRGGGGKDTWIMGAGPAAQAG
jgi:carboxylate-amine ligase